MQGWLVGLIRHCFKSCNICWTSERALCERKHSTEMPPDEEFLSRKKMLGKWEFVWGNEAICWGYEANCWGNEAKLWGNEAKLWGNEIKFFGEMPQVENTFENSQRRKVKQMQPMWLCIQSGRPLRTHLKTHSGEKSNICNPYDFACTDQSSLSKHVKRHTGQKSNKCNQCDYASTSAGNLRTYLKRHSWTMHSMRQAILGDIWKDTEGKGPTWGISYRIYISYIIF